VWQLSKFPAEGCQLMQDIAARKVQFRAARWAWPKLTSYLAAEMAPLLMTPNLSDPATKYMLLLLFLRNPITI